MIKSVLLGLTVGMVSLLQPAWGAVRVETFHGQEIAFYIPEVVRLCDQIYREYPYLYNGEDAGYEAYLESYAQSSESIVCLAFDGDKAIGVAAGIPMLQTRTLYQQPFLAHGYDLSTLFYLGEFGLKAEYQGQGIEEAMYRSIESFASRFHAIAFWQIHDPLNLTQKQLGYLLKESFWKQFGFVRHPELNFLIFWTNINDTQESPHLAVYWLKVMR